MQTLLHLLQSFHLEKINTAVLIIGSFLGFLFLFFFGRFVFSFFASIFGFIFNLIFKIAIGILSLLKTGYYTFKTAFILGLIAVALVLGWGTYVYWFKEKSHVYTTLRPPVCVEILDRAGEPFDYACPFSGVRLWRPLSQISKRLQEVVVFMEDAKFWDHEGLDMDELVNAIEKDIEKRKFARGGSTITQQLVKNLFLTKDKSLMRKATELPMALRIEKELTKVQILELYLNTIEWGPGVFGAEAASRLYFDHPASDLSEIEAWLLTLMIPNPKELNLWVAPKAKKSILNRAKHLSERFWTEKQMSRDEARVRFAQFEVFIDQWMLAYPQALTTHRFPMRWEKTNGEFAFEKSAKLKKLALDKARKLNATAVKLTLDKALAKTLDLESQGANLLE